MISNSKLCLLFLLNLLLIQSIKSQDTLIIYDKDHLTARINYQEDMRPNAEELKKTKFPAKGIYSPTAYSNSFQGIEPNVGFCNYIYIPTEGKLKPGIPYTVSMTIKWDAAYDEMVFCQENFGMALTSYMYPNKFPNHWGLWSHSMQPLSNLKGEEMVSLQFNFRPLCTSKYIVIGVFEGAIMEHMTCCFCKYEFELHSLNVVESTPLTNESVYICDEFKDAPPSPNQHEINVYFESGSSEIDRKHNIILDEIPSKIQTSQDLILLSAYTDKSGHDNLNLGAARNAAVRKALLERGIDDSKIFTINHSDTKSADYILSTDRRVEIDLGGGKLFKKLYMAALEAAEKEDYASAHKILLDQWIKYIPPKKSIYAIFDCWGESESSEIFQDHLLKAIKSKHYKNQELRFRLDSLYGEWLKGRTLSGHLTLNRMPGSKHNCRFNTSNERDSLLRADADKIFSEFGFPEKEKVGRRASHVLPKIILTSNDVTYLKKYLPEIKEACETGKLRWKSYADFYDVISIIENGSQRYGTRMKMGKNGSSTPVFPFEDESMVDEYRRQVKLAPFTKTIKEEIKSSQEKLDMDLVAELTDIFIADQHYRNKVGKNFRDWKKFKQSDSINQIKVKKILDERGWLGSDIVGSRGNTTLFLVIQHSDLKTQLTYLPMMQEAVKNGNAKASELALLEDRVSLGQTGMQIYGSQILRDEETDINYVAPILDPQTVNERRAEIGLGSIEKYISRWNLNWDEEKRMMFSRKKENK